jgi:hypothetical protein
MARSLGRYARALGGIGLGMSVASIALYYHWDGAGFEPMESLFGQEFETEYLLWADAGMSVVSMLGAPDAVASVVYTIGRNIDALKTPAPPPVLTFPKWVPQRASTYVKPRLMRVP